MSAPTAPPGAAGPVPGRGRRRRDWPAALLLLAIGAAASWGASAYPIGSLRQMGPGFFPLALGLLLVALGGLVLIEPPSPEDPTEREPLDARSFVLVGGAIVAFLLLVRFGGMVPATFALVALAALADRRTAPRTALALGALLTLLAVLLFRGLLGMPFPLLAWGG